MIILNLLSATSSPTVFLPSPMMSSAIVRVDDNLITRYPSQILCNLGFDVLNVLKDLWFVLNNLAENGMDLISVVSYQDWDLSLRPHGPVHMKLVKILNKNTVCDLRYMVPNFSGHKFVISELSSVRLDFVTPYGPFRKHWQNYVKTWFILPARKTRRRAARQKKAVRFVLWTLMVRSDLRTVKYNMKVNVGKGFSLEELKEGSKLFTRICVID